MAKGFASTTDMAEKKITFSEIGTDLYAFTAEGDPNSAVIVGEDGCLVFDAQATPAMANKVIERVRSVTDKPIKYVVLSHYHAVRVLGASAYKAQGIIASQETYRLIEERGQQDWDSEYGRFPRLFQDAESIPGLTWPTLTYSATRVSGSSPLTKPVPLRLVQERRQTDETEEHLVRLEVPQIELPPLDFGPPPK